MSVNSFSVSKRAQGLLKHLVNEEMDTRCETVDAYMQIIPPGSRSGKHRQLAEQAFYVLEGKGYDVHVDCASRSPTPTTGSLRRSSVTSGRLETSSISRRTRSASTSTPTPQSPPV